jgi:hypothetical protein
MITLWNAPGFTPSVGTAPGTTTLGVCPPGFFRPVHTGTVPPTSLPSMPGSSGAWNPYGSDAALRDCVGCARPTRALGATTIRWDLFALAFGAAFAGVLAWRKWGRK